MSQALRVSLLICSEQQERCEAMVNAVQKTALATTLRVVCKAAEAESELVDDHIDLILCDIDHPESQRVLNASQKHHAAPACIGFSHSLKHVHKQRGSWINRGGTDVIGIEQTELLLALAQRESQRRRREASGNALKASLFAHERQLNQLIKHSHLPSCCLVDGIPNGFNRAFSALWPEISPSTLAITPILDLVDKTERAKLKALLINSSKHRKSSHLAQLQLVNQQRVNASLSPMAFNGESSTLIQLSAALNTSSHEQPATRSASSTKPQPKRHSAPEHSAQSMAEAIVQQHGQAAALLYLKIKSPPLAAGVTQALQALIRDFIQPQDRLLPIKGRSDVVILLSQRSESALSNDALLNSGQALSEALSAQLTQAGIQHQIAAGLADLRLHQDSAKATIGECYQAASQAILSKKRALLTDKSRQDLPQQLSEALQSNTLPTQLRPIANLAGDTRQRYLLQAPLSSASEKKPLQALELEKLPPKVQKALDQWLLQQAIDLLNDAESDNIKVSLFLPCSAAFLACKDTLQLLEKSAKVLLKTHRLVLRIKAHEATKSLEKWLEITRRWQALGCEIYLDQCLALNSELTAIKHLKPQYIMLHPSLVKRVCPASSKRIQTLSSLCHQGLIASAVNDLSQLTTVWDLGLDLIIGDIVDNDGQPLTLQALAC